MSRRLILSAALALGAALVTGPFTGALADPGAEGAQPENPLEPFERLVGGAWHLDGSYQVFEWGHDRRIVRATSVVFVEGERKQVSEGFWVWHPGEEVLRGYVVASGMPVSFFDYRSRFEGNTFVHELAAFGPMGGGYVERWSMDGDDRYVWSLLQDRGDGPELVMDGTFERVEWPLDESPRAGGVP